MKRLATPYLSTLTLMVGLATILTGLTLRADNTTEHSAMLANPTMANATLATATFAGGCFWCMEPPFEKLKGVTSVISGYMGGHVKNPTYRQVSHGTTGHAEVVQIRYDPAKISYQTLLNVYWQQIDPTDDSGSFVDRGDQYRSAIFYHTAEQKQGALQSKQQLDRSGFYPQPMVTPVTAAHDFYPAEAYHQDFYKTHAVRYKSYRYRSGRDQYIEKTWSNRTVSEVIMDKTAMTPNQEDQQPTPFKKPNDRELNQRLTALQYEVTQENGTERPFDNEYWDNKQAGIYVDIVSGEPLFSSTDKFDSKTGWPSFTQPIRDHALVEKKDGKFFMVRTEVRSQQADSHLGHVFDDGPAPTGKRYCINSASLRFIPKENLPTQGYAPFAKLFK